MAALHTTPEAPAAQLQRAEDGAECHPDQEEEEDEDEEEDEEEEDEEDVEEVLAEERSSAAGNREQPGRGGDARSSVLQGEGKKRSQPPREEVRGTWLGHGQARPTELAGHQGPGFEMRQHPGALALLAGWLGWVLAGSCP